MFRQPVFTALFATLLLCCSANLSHASQGTATSKAGHSVAYDVLGQGGQSGSGPAIVFVHGWSCDRTYWKPQMDALSRQFTVVAVDLVGHGKSSLGSKEDWTIASFGGDVAAVVEKLDLKRVVLVGHSMGGDVTADAARRLPGRVAGVVWVDVYKQLSTSRTPEQIKSFVDSFSTDFASKTSAFVRGMFPASADKALVERVALDMSSAPPAVALASMESSISNDRRVVGILREAKVPVIAINPAEPPTDLESMRKANIEVVLMPGVGHFLMMEDPERFNVLLIDAIRKLTK
jgi:pimeloyl-ACP methyl ester carboxylesterase